MADPLYQAPGNYDGLLEQGNIDLGTRPQVKNKDGSVSTVRSMSFADEPNGPEILIPTVAKDGSRILTDDEAIKQYHDTGQHLGKFTSPDQATAYAQALHKQQEAAYGLGPAAAPPVQQPAPVPVGTHATKGTRTNEQLVPSPELQAGQAAEQKVIGDEKKLAGDEAATQTEGARIQAEQAQQVSEENDRRNAEIQAEQQHQADLQQQRNDKWLSDLEAIKASKAPGGFEDWTGEKKTRGYLAIVLGGLASGNTGGVNTGLAQINKQVEDQRKAYTADLETKFKVLEQQHGFNSTLDSQARDAIAQGYARKALAIDSLNKQADAQLKALGIPAAQQAGIKAQLGFDKQAADAQQKYGQIVSVKSTDATQFAPGKGGAGVGGGVDRLSKLHEFARTHTGPDGEAQVVAAAEQLFPELRGKPEKLQTLVAGAVKASQDAKVASGSSVPTNFDVGTEHYTVDPSQTTVRGNTAARAQLGLIEGAIKNGDEALALVPHGAPTNFGLVSGDTKRSDVNAKIASLRNAAASALKESMGQEAGKERAEAIFPDLPHTDMGMAQWRTKVKAGLDTMKVLKAEALHAAGGHLAPAGAKGTPSTARPDPIDTAIDAQAAQYGL